MKKIIHAEDVPLPDPLTQEREALEVRIREIIREELTAWEKRQVQKARFGLPVNAEVKSPPAPSVDKRLIGTDY